MDPIHNPLVPAINVRFAVQGGDVNAVRGQEIVRDLGGIQVLSFKISQETDTQTGQLLQGKVGQKTFLKLLQEAWDLDQSGWLSQLIQNGFHHQGLIANSEGIRVIGADAHQS